MQGLWKEKLSGWNYKDTKRKKTKRKHTIKEKLNAYRKVDFHNDKVLPKEKYNKEYELIVETIKDKENESEIQKGAYVFLAKITYTKEPRSWKSGFNEKEEIIEKVYFENGYLFFFNRGLVYVELDLDELYKKIHKTEDIPSYWSLGYEFSFKCELLTTIDYITWDISEKDRFEIEVSNRRNYDTKEKIFGKYIPEYYYKYRMYYYKNRKSQKYTQNQDTRKRRRETRDYIKHQNWDKELNHYIYYGYYDW